MARERIFNGRHSRKFGQIERVALRKLTILDAAENLSHPAGRGNSLEALKGNREGQYAIRVNDQHRLWFRWSEGNASDVEIVDYHD